MDAATVALYHAKEDELQADILRQLNIGGTEEYSNTITLFPIGRIQSPVRIPAWMFRKYPNHKQLELNDIEKVAMAHVIHFTNPCNPTGYVECSGNIENWCKCSVEEAHNALVSLTNKNLITQYRLSPELCFGHKRNCGYSVNVEYLHSLLNLYKMDIWT